MKVGEQAMYLARLKGMSKEDAREKLLIWFEKFGITDWWDKKIQELSKGMAQKVQFIVTVLHEPKLLIFDEPFSGFDPVNAELIANEILELKEKGATIIFSTHRMESVEKMCDYIVLIHKSKKILEGNLVELQKKYRTYLFEIGIKTEDEDKLKKELSLDYQIKDANFQTLHNDVRLMVQLKEGQSTEALLEKMKTLGSVTHFLEQIPTMNSIFMNAVSNQFVNN